MKFYGNGMVWDKLHKKVLCTFENGIYETEDKREIGILNELGYKYDGELEIKLNKSELEIQDLKKELESAKKGKVDPDILQRVKELEENNKKLKEELVENERAKTILIEKGIQLKVINKKEAKSLDLIAIAEIFNGILEGE